MQNFKNKYGYDPYQYGWANAPHRTAASYQQEKKYHYALGKFLGRKNRRSSTNKLRSYGLRRYQYKRKPSTFYRRRYTRPRVIYKTIYKNKSSYLKDYMNKRTQAALNAINSITDTQSTLATAISAITPGPDTSGSAIEPDSSVWFPEDEEASRELKRSRTK